MAKIKDSVPEMEYFEKIDTYIYSYKVGKGYIVVDYSGCENDVEHHYYKGSYWNPPEDYSELKTEEHIVNEYYLTEEDYNNVKISTREEFMKALDLSEADMKDIMYFVDGDSYEKYSISGTESLIFAISIFSF